MNAPHILLVLTRQSSQNEQIASDLRAAYPELNQQVVLCHMPLLQLSDLPDSLPEAALLDNYLQQLCRPMTLPHVLFMVSAYATHAINKRLAYLGLTLPLQHWLLLPGLASAHIAQALWPDHQVARQIICPLNSASQDALSAWATFERTLAAYPVSAGKMPQHLTVFRAQQGDDVLLQRAARAGFTSTAIMCYQRTAAAINDAANHALVQALADKEKPYIISLISSKEALAAYHHQINRVPALMFLPQAAQSRLWTHHASIAHAAQKAGWQRVIQAPLTAQGFVTCVADCSLFNKT